MAYTLHYMLIGLHQGMYEQEQNAMQIRHSQEYEHYRLLQLKEVQMLKANPGTNPPNIPHTNPVSSLPLKITVPSPEIVQSNQLEPQTTMQSSKVQVLSPKSVQLKLSKSDDGVKSSASRQSPVEQSISIPNAKLPDTKQFTAKRESRSRRVPPPPPPPPSIRPHSSSTPLRIELNHNQNEVASVGAEIPRKEEQTRPAPSKRSRSRSPMSREEIERARSSSQRREERSRSPIIDGPRRQRLPVKRPKSDRKPKPPRHPKFRHHRESTIQQRMESFHHATPYRPHKPSMANPDAASHYTTQVASGNAPPTVTSGKNKPNDDMHRSIGDKHRRDSVPSALTVENVPGQGMNVVRRYTGGKKPMEILGDPRHFDDALHKPTPSTPIIQNRTPFQGLCFMQRNTRKVLGSVAEVEPVIRSHFTSGSFNNMDL